MTDPLLPEIVGSATIVRLSKLYIYSQHLQARQTNKPSLQDVACCLFVISKYALRV